MTGQIEKVNGLQEWLKFNPGYDFQRFSYKCTNGSVGFSTITTTKLTTRVRLHLQIFRIIDFSIFLQHSNFLQRVLEFSSQFYVGNQGIQKGGVVRNGRSLKDIFYFLGFLDDLIDFLANRLKYRFGEI
ncbi:Protein CBG00504 [Caenorhabditis briggsae]|uniref:Protein CBG00504 n=1 Tax=Caenorhabditis briggsae TaxID=6238 RepID=A8WMT8_CAEBR|nr:Protein CBG00504 [Caenorhabditis briggsae]CAP21793.2 Protein CBG00504 [Caenorhabditis briggsae]